MCKVYVLTVLITLSDIFFMKTLGSYCTHELYEVMCHITVPTL